MSFNFLSSHSVMLKKNYLGVIPWREKILQQMHLKLFFFAFLYTRMNNIFQILQCASSSKHKLLYVGQ